MEKERIGLLLCLTIIHRIKPDINTVMLAFAFRAVTSDNREQAIRGALRYYAEVSTLLFRHEDDTSDAFCTCRESLVRIGLSIIKKLAITSDDLDMLEDYYRDHHKDSSNTLKWVREFRNICREVRYAKAAPHGGGIPH